MLWQLSNLQGVLRLYCHMVIECFRGENAPQQLLISEEPLASLFLRRSCRGRKKKKDRKKTAWQVCWIKSRHVIWSWKCLFKKRNILKYFLGKFLDYVMSLVLGIYVVNKPPSNSIYYFNKLPLYSPTKTVDFFHFFFFQGSVVSSLCLSRVDILRRMAHWGFTAHPYCLLWLWITHFRVTKHKWPSVAVRLWWNVGGVGCEMRNCASCAVSWGQLMELGCAWREDLEHLPLPRSSSSPVQPHLIRSGPFQTLVKESI